MPSVLHLCRPFDARPNCPPATGIQVRHFSGDADIAAWLQLRNQAFAHQRLGVRKWSLDDFCNEFTCRWWWRPEHMWLAESSAAFASNSAADRLIGSVALAMRGEPAKAHPVVHWLMVDPAWRRRGIARLLMAHVERAAWDAGHRELSVETHAAWTAATHFYRTLGYLPEEH